MTAVRARSAVPPVSRVRRGTDRARQFGDEVVAVVFGELDPAEIVHPGGIVDVVVDLGEPAPVGLACRIVDRWHAAAGGGDPTRILVVAGDMRL